MTKRMIPANKELLHDIRKYTDPSVYNPGYRHCLIAQVAEKSPRVKPYKYPECPTCCAVSRVAQGYGVNQAYVHAIYFNVFTATMEGETKEQECARAIELAAKILKGPLPE